MATVLVVGSGGREMAQATALAASNRVARVLVAPGNGGTAAGLAKVSNVDIKDTAIEDLVDCAKKNAVDLVAVGPEAPLVIGLSDAMGEAGVKCFGPTKIAAQLENSKAWMKDFFQRHGLPTARYKTFTDFAEAKAHVEAISYEVVVKCSGLAAGKGVLIPSGKEEAIEALKKVMVEKVFGSAGDEVVVEEKLIGPECSVLAFCDGTSAVCMPAAQDHKRALDNDMGPNTGGMGAYARCPCLTAELEVQTSQIIQDTVSALKADGIKYVGVLFAGFMLTSDGPRLLEYNCRMGDPETQVVLPLLVSDLYEVMLSCCDGQLAAQKIAWSEEATATVVMAARGYPDKYAKGATISGLAEAGAVEGVTVFHAGTRLEGSAYVTNGGRVLAVTGRGETLSAAVAVAYEGVSKIAFEEEGGAHFRKDIASKASVVADCGKIVKKRALG
mmetsp:Transcript_70878/g.117762  ORF Transcript_70878/g.117762 Transcript_70878/m.117762 type:complete len:443 (+) Transcript_70878:25-1353(+)|eukprot:CAMPEP_0119320072 /NCGR_PEP_ID=MMETSP1333-20130426/51336_1 /TAXON_ID=418940 /ORGANISM="Scyphosphaera apsteinii, Strain RCC1455" /LENGTH=442 /DNA_ID=CAMNT_0007326679 /DNA_START=19 /DNA_END=1347 /DNA_ORIENTATION=+